MTPPEDPLQTHQLFDHARVAEGYAHARPYLHPDVFARVRAWLPAGTRFERALDVGCGTGLSSLALADLAAQVVGIDAATSMLKRARRSTRVRYAASLAEDLPFRPGSFDLVVACGSIDWVDRARFLPRVAELLRPGGWLVPLDFGDRGRSDEAPGLERWYRDVFQRDFPAPPTRDPYVTREEAACHGFSEPVLHEFEQSWSFTAQQYAQFLASESAVVARVEYGGARAEDVVATLEADLTPLLGGRERRLVFGGYAQLLQYRPNRYGISHESSELDR
jgi:SAM-dependent methyltransferase